MASPLAALFRAHWRPVAVTYTLFAAESLLHLLQPLALGRAINGLLQGEAAGLGLLAAQHLGWLGVGTARRRYDTRAFTAIYTATVTRLVERQRAAGVPVSAVAARSALSRELVDFFEHDLKAVFAAAFGVIGAVVLLAGYDPVLAGFCLLTLGPLVVLNRRLARRSLALNAALNDQLEREVAAVEDGRAEAVAAHYRAAAGWRVQLSDLEAMNFFRMEFAVLGLILAALARYCSHPGATAGDIYAVFAYVLLFVNGLDAVPEVVQQAARLRDIGRRVAGEPEGNDDG